MSGVQWGWWEPTSALKSLHAAYIYRKGQTVGAAVTAEVKLGTKPYTVIANEIDPNGEAGSYLSDQLIETTSSTTSAAAGGGGRQTLCANRI